MEALADLPSSEHGVACQFFAEIGLLNFAREIGFVAAAEISYRLADGLATARGPHD